MSNMSYCRFQNTDGDLADCKDDLERRCDGETEDERGDPVEPLSDRETRAAHSLIDRCRDVVELVMAARGLHDLDELTDREIGAFISDLNNRIAREADDRAENELDRPAGEGA